MLSATVRNHGVWPFRLRGGDCRASATEREPLTPARMPRWCFYTGGQAPRLKGEGLRCRSGAGVPWSKQDLHGQAGFSKCVQPPGTYSNPSCACLLRHVGCGRMQVRFGGDGVGPIAAACEQVRLR